MTPAVWLRSWPGRSGSGRLAVVSAGALDWRGTRLIVMLQGGLITIFGSMSLRRSPFRSSTPFSSCLREEIVPLMQTITADMCMALLALVGIPAHIEGVFISPPPSISRFAEACFRR